MIFWEIAKRNVKLHLLRSILAMLGIVIGVVAISTMGILGNSMVLAVSSSMSSVGDSVIITSHSSASGFGGGGGGGRTLQTLRISDQTYQEIKRITQPNTAIAIMSGSDRMRIGSKNVSSQVYGLDPDDVITLLKIDSGTYLRGLNSCLVGPTFAKDNNVKVGSRITIGENETLRVTGIIEERGMSFDISTDSAIAVSRNWFENRNKQTSYNTVVVKV
ncbi:MAG: ABC transporter permease, partial [Methanomicrobiales archaeon HGW-Methanomicrobiales-4]